MTDPTHGPYCTRCGTNVGAGTAYCPSCGAQREVTAPAAGPVQAAATVSSAPAAAAVRVKPSAAGWFVLVGGTLFALAAFFTWATGTLGDGLGSESVQLTGEGRFLAVALGFALVAVAWPAMSEGHFSGRRLTGLVVLAGVTALFAILCTAGTSHNAHLLGLSHANVAFGAVLGWIGAITVWIGTVRVWMRRRRTPAAAS